MTRKGNDKKKREKKKKERERERERERGGGRYSWGGLVMDGAVDATGEGDDEVFDLEVTEEWGELVYGEQGEVRQEVDVHFALVADDVE
jgi:hypothetical protein